MPTYIKLETGDFGEMYTFAFMFHEESFDIPSLVSEFMDDVTPDSQKKYIIKTTGKRCIVSDLGYLDLQTHDSWFRNFLKRKGFKDLFEKANEVVFSD
jgi:hypothetical protein